MILSFAIMTSLVKHSHLYATFWIRNSGKYAMCYQARRVTDGREVAIKILSRYGSSLNSAVTHPWHWYVLIEKRARTGW